MYKLDTWRLLDALFALYEQSANCTLHFLRRDACGGSVGPALIVIFQPEVLTGMFGGPEKLLHLEAVCTLRPKIK